MKQNIAVKDKKIRKEIHIKFNNIASPDENKYKNILVEIYLKAIKREAEIQGLRHAAEADLGYLLARFQPLQPPSTQSETPLALIPLASKSRVSYKVCTEL
jgi:Xaa-Pro aminopeptidase